MHHQPAEVEELYSSWALLILTVLMIGAMWTSYYLQVRKVTSIHETVISIMTGKEKKMHRLFMFIQLSWCS